jgi:hypothetical protein
MIFIPKKYVPRWMDRWINGWIDGKAIPRITYSNKNDSFTKKYVKHNEKSELGIGVGWGTVTVVCTVLYNKKERHV